MKVMHFMLVLLAFFCLLSCTNNTKENPIKSQKDIGNFLEVLEIDSCEYISRCLGCNNGILTHKGNCKYCLTRKN